jgi:hypothetical protein
MKTEIDLYDMPEVKIKRMMIGANVSLSNFEAKRALENNIVQQINCFKTTEAEEKWIWLIMLTKKGFDHFSRTFKKPKDADMWDWLEIDNVKR